MNTIESIIEKHESTLVELVNQRYLKFDNKLRSRLPSQGGVYRVIDGGENLYHVIYVGQTKNLQNRVYNDLLMGNLPRHTLKRKLVNSGIYPDKKAAKDYLKEKCMVQYVEIYDVINRKLFEHFAIAILRPEWNA